MAIMKLRENEFRSVLEVMSQRGIELVYSVEKDGVYIYGSEHVIQEVEHIIWAADVVQEIDFHQETGVSYAMSMQK